MNQNAQGIITEYLNFFPQEKRRLTEIIERFPLGKSIVSRTDFIGHITVSAFVFSPDKKNVLLIYHKQLQKFLQPGGHIENSDVSLLDACRRELKEETGLQDPLLFNLTGHEIPIDIDIHLIPANKRK
ncbi:MAG TPA: NUDIX hydrolase, partial [Candidatus Moranbacteria bacterium]|nr:NUDIX hydrolase [Candidatus Moranbacteria bacterium]